jgi:prophage regulatory protein
MARTAQTTPSPSTTDRFLRWPEVKDRVGLSRSQIHVLISRGEFPVQIKLGPRSSAWLESSVDAWMESRVMASNRGANE